MWGKEEQNNRPRLPAGRRFSVVDVWEALTSDRPYRKAWSKKKALKSLHEQAGVSSDPGVVEQFMCVMNEKQT